MQGGHWHKPGDEYVTLNETTLILSVTLTLSVSALVIFNCDTQIFSSWELVFLDFALHSGAEEGRGSMDAFHGRARRGHM